MATQLSPERWTYEEFAKLPEDGNRYEIIAGELYVTKVNFPLHQEVLASVLAPLYRFEEMDHDIGTTIMGPVDVLFAEGDFLEPDIVFVRRDRDEIITDRAVEGVPDLIVEVVSPATADRDRGLKRERYAHYGVPEYWIVDAEQRMVEVFRLFGNSSYTEIVATGSFEWQPVPEGPVLSLNVPELLEGYDSLRELIEENERARKLPGAV